MTAPGYIFDIQTYALYDGPGIRTAVYFKGCPLRCFWCHNPESQKAEPETALDGRRFGEEASAEYIVEKVLADLPFFEQSGGGVTLTGGEPTARSEFLFAITGLLREHNIHIALETCGHFASHLVPELAEQVDLFLFDLKHADSDKHREVTGTGNERIVQNFAALLTLVGSDRIIPRIPLIPGVNTDKEDLCALLAILEDNNYKGDIHLMPWHGWAKSKYADLDRADEFRDLTELNGEELEYLSQLAINHGYLPVLYGE